MSALAYGRLLAEVVRKATELVPVADARRNSRITKKELASLKTPWAIPQQLLDYGRTCNGFRLHWTVEGLPPSSSHSSHEDTAIHGAFNLLSLQQVYWYGQGDLYHGRDDEDPRLQSFYIVDNYTDEQHVGLLIDGRDDPELYWYRVEEDLNPLRVDLQGYCRLLELSLGFMHWQAMLSELSHQDGPAVGSGYQPSTSAARRFVELMPRIDPSFTLDAFLALYDQVRLPR